MVIESEPCLLVYMNEGHIALTLLKCLDSNQNTHLTQLLPRFLKNDSSVARLPWMKFVT